jgi:hypothetical protein
MSYRSPLEPRVAKKTTKAITDFNLIEDGDPHHGRASPAARTAGR